MSLRTAVQVHIRWLIKRDMEEVLAIEQASFPDPWSEDTFLVCLRQQNQIGLVAELGDKIVGFMIYRVRDKQIIVLNLAVHKAYRRMRVGQQFISRLKKKVRESRRQRIITTIDDENLSAHQFLRHQKFEAINVYRDYFDPGDGYLFRWKNDELR